MRTNSNPNEGRGPSRNDFPSVCRQENPPGLVDFPGGIASFVGGDYVLARSLAAGFFNHQGTGPLAIRCPAGGDEPDQHLRWAAVRSSRCWHCGADEYSRHDPGDGRPSARRAPEVRLSGPRSRADVGAVGRAVFGRLPLPWAENVWAKADISTRRGAGARVLHRTADDFSGPLAYPPSMEDNRRASAGICLPPRRGKHPSGQACALGDTLGGDGPLAKEGGMLVSTAYVEAGPARIATQKVSRTRPAPRQRLAGAATPRGTRASRTQAPRPPLLLSETPLDP